MQTKISPETTIFIALSFEGPDPYSQAGGLGTRMNNLCESLAEQGYETHLFFVGDPSLPGEESRVGGRYVLHRWCQWLSHHHPGGVYDNEDSKVTDYTWTVPAYVLNHIARPAAGAGKRIVVMAEEWHTADALMGLSDVLHQHGLLHMATLLWNANNTMSFHRINWGRLTYVAHVTAVSKFMKHVMWGQGINAIVVPNGIPERMLTPSDPETVFKLRGALKGRGTDLAVLKIGRFDPAKRWIMAVETVARLKARGIRTTFLVRGGMEPHGADVFRRAAELGLSVQDVTAKRPNLDKCIDLIGHAPQADILNLRFFLPEEFVMLLYQVTDCVFANSGFEPFGLVGLEVMAAGGIAFTGATGEDYVTPFVNAISVETDDPREMESYLSWLHENPERKEDIKKRARETARDYIWPTVIRNLVQRIEFLSS